MKLIYLTNSNDKNFEGARSIFFKLKKNFLKKRQLIINDISKIDKGSIVNIHSSGFYESIKYFKKIKSPIIYSLHSNIVPISFKLIKDYFEFYLFIYLKNKDIFSLKDRILKTILSSISNFIPLFVKRIFLSKMHIIVLPNKWLSNLLKLKNSCIIHQGINIKKFKKIKVNKNYNNINLSYFGHPSPGKGLLELTKTFSKLNSNKYSKNLFVTRDNDKIIKYVHDKDKSIKVHGFTNNIVEEYNNSDIVVLPYRHASAAIATPLVLLEAMACERAIITSDLPHLREICGDSVIYCKPYSVKDLKEKIEYLTKRPELRKKLGKKARERVVKYYNQEKMFKQYEELYKKIIKENE